MTYFSKILSIINLYHIISLMVFFLTVKEMESSFTPLAWERVYEEICTNGREALMCLHCKKVAKGGGIHRMKKHLARVKEDIGPCKSVPSNVRFRMEKTLQELVKSKQAVQEAHECENPYGPNVSQFNGDITGSEDEVQQIKNPIIITISSGKRKKSMVDNYFAPRTSQGAQPSIRSVLAGQEVIWRVDMAVGRFFYDACIPINVVNSFYFKPMLDAIGAIDLGYKGLFFGVFMPLDFCCLYIMGILFNVPF